MQSCLRIDYTLSIYPMYENINESTSMQNTSPSSLIHVYYAISPHLKVDKVLERASSMCICNMGKNRPIHGV